MAFCVKCGTQLKDGAVFCTHCGASVFEDAGDYYGGQELHENLDFIQADPVPQSKAKTIATQVKDAAIKAAGVAAEAVKTNAEQRKETNAQNRMNRKIQLAEGEIGIRTYNVTRGKAPGKLTVTNKRLIFSAASGSSKVFMSTPIDTVGSIDIITGRSVLYIIIGILLCLTVIGILPGIILFIKSKSMLLSISASNSSPGLVIGQVATSGKASKAIYGSPGPDAGKVMSEIGALILDIQQSGDAAIEKWRQ